MNGAADSGVFAKLLSLSLSSERRRSLAALTCKKKKQETHSVKIHTMHLHNNVISWNVIYWGETVHKIQGLVHVTVLGSRLSVWFGIVVVVVFIFKHSRNTIHHHKIRSHIIDHLQYCKKLVLLKDTSCSYAQTERIRLFHTRHIIVTILD